MSAKRQDNRLLQLCDRVCAGTADENEVAELERLMTADPAAREIFLNWSALHADLLSVTSAARSRAQATFRIDDESPTPQQPVIKGGRGKRGWTTWIMLSLAASIVLFVGVAINQQHEDEQVAAAPADRDGRSLPPIDGMAIVNRLDGVVWSQGARPAAVGDLLRSSHPIEIDAGVAEIEFGQGAVVLLEGPARFVAKSTSLGLLDSGKLAAVVPPWAEGFQIDTPSLGVIDRGTQFIVEVTLDRDVNVGVAKGAVELVDQSGGDTGRAVESSPRQLATGAAVRAADSEISDVAFDSDWRVLTSQLPARPDHSEVEVVARYRRDFVPSKSDQPRRDGAWRYYANQWMPVDDNEGYVELKWDMERGLYDPSGNRSRLAGSRLGAANLSYRGGHPGQGRDQTKDDLDHYVIAAYQVDSPGNYRLESGWLVRAESRDDIANQAVDLRVRVNQQRDRIHETCNRDGLLRFHGDLGSLHEGDWIYVAVGPRGISYNDRFEWDFAIVREIESPERL